MSVLGIDEVGRGPWAGPLVAGAVVLKEPIEGLNDSKKLSAKKRQFLSSEIVQKSWVGLGWVSAAEIDKIGLSKSVQLAMLRAVKELHKQGVVYSQIIIDGNINYFKNVNGLLADDVAAAVGADGAVAAVSAASIVAKVARDEFMTKIAEKYPGYGFERHVGYGTAAHVVALKSLGACPEHRMSFKPLQNL